MRIETTVIAVSVAAVAGFFAGSSFRRSSDGRSDEAKQGPAVARADEPAEKTTAIRQQPVPETPVVFKVPVSRDEPTKGREDALVTIVEWTDFQCPFCSRAHATLQRIEEHYGDRVRVVVRMNPLPFHDAAMPAAEAAMAAHAQGKFWPMHDGLFADQRSLNRATFERLAEQIGLDMGRFRRDLDRHAHRAQIEAQQRAGAALGARGTPAFFVNGKSVRGAQSFERFQAVIDAAFETARTAMRENHLPPSRVYDFLVRDGATGPVPRAGTERLGGAAEPDRVYTIAPAPHAPRRGGRNARVVIHELSDYQCPFCARVEPTVARLLERYGDRIEIVWRNFPLPFHDHAMLAAEAAMEAHAQGKFWRMHDVLFENQRALERADLERHAQTVGLDMARFRAALDRHTHRAEIDADVQASRSSGARHGTPAFFINGRLLQGAQPLEAFVAAIDRAFSDTAASAARARVFPAVGPRAVRAPEGGH